jgi:membrane-associated phospholipid phosphatase
MKHVRPDRDAVSAPEPVSRPLLGPVPLPMNPSGQSRTSILIALALGLFLVAVVLDTPVRALADSLDPSLKTVLRRITNFGNSAWPLGIGLALLMVVRFLRGRSPQIRAADLQSLRSSLLLMIGAVAISGFFASLSKHVIGRIRPSADPDAQVLEFAVMAFRSSWASFPSGHATTATAAALALALAYHRQAWAWLALGLMASLSRALLGVHWFTDCLAGILLGLAVTLALHKAMLARGHQPQVSPGVLGQALSVAALQLWALATSALARFRARALSRTTPPWHP